MSKLMLVEDDNNLREIYEARLQAEGYQIVSARDGEEALVVAKAEKPDLIISDVMMPKISGFEMLDILRNTDGLKDVKVIMLTALGQTDDQQRADRLGADRYLVKSQVTLEDIVRVAHELLGDNSAAAAVAPSSDDDTTQAGDDTSAEPNDRAKPQPPTNSDAEDSDQVIPVTSEPSQVDDNGVVEAPKAEAAAEESAQPAAQEEAGIENKIEDFVAGATQDAAPPAVISPDNTEAVADKPESDLAATTEPAAPATPPAKPTVDPGSIAL